MSLIDERLKQFHKNNEDPGGNGAIQWQWRVKVWKFMMSYYKAKKMWENVDVSSRMLKFAQKQLSKRRFKK